MEKIVILLFAALAHAEHVFGQELVRELERECAKGRMVVLPETSRARIKATFEKRIAEVRPERNAAIFPRRATTRRTARRPPRRGARRRGSTARNCQRARLSSSSAAGSFAAVSRRRRELPTPPTGRARSRASIRRRRMARTLQSGRRRTLKTSGAILSARLTSARSSSTTERPMRLRYFPSTTTTGLSRSSTVGVHSTTATRISLKTCISGTTTPRRPTSSRSRKVQDICISIQ